MRHVEPITDYSKMEVIPDNIPQKDVIDESNRRAAKQGWCTRDGLPPFRTKIQTTSGFGSEKLNVWPRDTNGNLIP